MLWYGYYSAMHCKQCVVLLGYKEAIIGIRIPILAAKDCVLRIALENTCYISSTRPN